MKVNRQKLRVSNIKNTQKEEVAQLTKAEALSFVWDLTEEIYSLSGKFDVKSRLQRDVISITRK
jgi:hypothetical protein